MNSSSPTIVNRDSSRTEPYVPDILLVDDIPDNLRFLSNFLADRNYRVRKAVNGKMALAAVQALPPDLILLDINMPDMTGYEVCRYLKENPTTSSIPIIFLSAASETIDKVEGFRLGAVDYITKPFQLEEVLVRVQTQLTVRELQKKSEEQNIQLQQALDNLKKAQEHLVHQEKMATLKKVVAGVAHEVNNPLSFIFCNTEPAHQHIHNLLTILALYQQSCPQPPPEVQALIEEIDLEFVTTDLIQLMKSMKTGASRIHAVMAALKNFTHLDESGFKEIDIHQNIEAVLALLRYRLGARNDEFQIQVEKDYGTLPPIYGYAEQINQVLFNLILNAVEAIECKYNHWKRQFFQPQIKIWTEIRGYESMVIGIQDNGIGISLESQARLFEPFFTTKPAGQGLGLGLVTSRRIIEEMHNGRLSYVSSAEKGTQWVIELPLFKQGSPS
ncbi:response regulator [Desertifilum sp. FACHB-1129]|uniref:sensor histidine kinase n=1 Tax=Desertifilum TaxID=1185872 RepID=UPI0009F5E27C|nr:MULTISPECIES: response regulator [Desertifilum]MBD2314074.1 response regulator [Desertifilum sp. FACHB-1129]MBD2321040.1 response regulator [Desertifilum sp. FACHB-866]MBD2331169.1 response regulator [Desertifilum sp. FACHB-868]